MMAIDTPHYLPACIDLLSIYVNFHVQFAWCSLASNRETINQYSNSNLKIYISGSTFGFLNVLHILHVLLNFSELGGRTHLLYSIRGLIHTPHHRTFTSGYFPSVYIHWRMWWQKHNWYIGSKTWSAISGKNGDRIIRNEKS